MAVGGTVQSDTLRDIEQDFLRKQKEDEDNGWLPSRKGKKYDQTKAVSSDAMSAMFHVDTKSPRFAPKAPLKPPTPPPNWL